MAAYVSARDPQGETHRDRIGSRGRDGTGCCLLDGLHVSADAAVGGDGSVEVCGEGGAVRCPQFISSSPFSTVDRESSSESKPSPLTRAAFVVEPQLSAISAFFIVVGAGSSDASMTAMQASSPCLGDGAKQSTTSSCRRETAGALLVALLTPEPTGRRHTHAAINARPFGLNCSASMVALS